MRKLSKLLSILMILALMLIQPISALAADNIAEGTYNISASLSCYISAMGGIEFGKPLLKSAQLIVDKNGNKKIKLNLTKGNVTIYNVSCETFIDASPAGATSDRGVKSGTIGVYDKSGTLQTGSVSYTLSKDTALNSKSESVKYVNSITFPVDHVSDTYNLSFYINSNVMGMQFCNKNDKATSDTYQATLTVDWNSVKSSNNNSGNSTTKSSGTSKSTTKASGATSTNKSGSGGSVNNESANTSGSSANGSTTKVADSAENTNDESIETASEENNDTADSNEQSSENVVEKDGLNIHYANGDESLGSSSTDNTKVPFYVYLNMPVLIGMAVFAVVLIIAGCILLYVAKKQKEKKEHE